MFEPSESSEPSEGANANANDSAEPTSEWDTDEALANLKMERVVHGLESNEKLTRRLMEEAAPMAATSIIHLSRNAGNENTKLAASKYIVDYLLGDQTDGGTSSWEQLIGNAVSNTPLMAEARDA